MVPERLAWLREGISKLIFTYSRKLGQFRFPGQETTFGVSLSTYKRPDLCNV